MLKDLKKKASKILAHNHRTGTLNGIKYDYTCPSAKPGMYPHEWLWDSSFHSIVLTHFNPARAKREIKTLLSKQEKSGFLSCVSIWEKSSPLDSIIYITKITQPPVVAYAALRVYEKTRDKDFLKTVYPKIKSLLCWLKDNRDENGNGLIRIIHPWEAGIDTNPSTDKEFGIKSHFPSVIINYAKLIGLNIKYLAMGWNEKKIYKSRSFQMESVLFNSIYAQALLSIGKIARILGNNEDEKKFKKLYRKVFGSLIKNCWSEKDGFFYDLDRNAKQIRVKTVSGLMPLILPDLPKKITRKLIEKHILNEKEFWSKYPVPSVSMDEPTFNPGNSLILWRGPTWVNTNWFINKALLYYGYKSEAHELTKRTSEMIARFGFCEFYNPLTGEGYGQPNFGWSTLVTDMV
jgi:glycogen debranching enzyme